MNPCIGWHADPPCPTYGKMHGCVSPAGHDETGRGRAKQHKCKCGAVARPEHHRGKAGRTLAAAVAVATLAACGGSDPHYVELGDETSATESTIVGASRPATTTTIPATTTTFVGAETAAARAWWDSLDDLHRFAVCDTYLAYITHGGGQQEFVDFLISQGAPEPMAWAITAVLAERCRG